MSDLRIRNRRDATRRFEVCGTSSSRSPPARTQNESLFPKHKLERCIKFFCHVQTLYLPGTNTNYYYYYYPRCLLVWHTRVRMSAYPQNQFKDRSNLGETRAKLRATRKGFSFRLDREKLGATLKFEVILPVSSRRTYKHSNRKYKMSEFRCKIESLYVPVM